MISSQKAPSAGAISAVKAQTKYVQQLREAHSAIKLIRLQQLLAMLAVSRSWLYDKLNPQSPRFDPSFPRPIKLGKSTVAFDLAAVEAWVQQCASQSQLICN